MSQVPGEREGTQPRLDQTIGMRRLDAGNTGPFWDTNSSGLNSCFPSGRDKDFYVVEVSVLIKTNRTGHGTSVSNSPASPRLLIGRATLAYSPQDGGRRNLEHQTPTRDSECLATNLIHDVFGVLPHLFLLRAPASSLDPILTRKG